MDLEHIHKNYGDSLFSICMRYSKDKSEAEDIYHDGLLHIQKHLHQYKAKGSLEGWCKRLIVTTAITRFRKQKHEPDYIDSFNDEQTIVEDDSNTEDQKSVIFNAEFSGEEIRNILQTLPNKCRSVFNLYVFEDMKHKEIAKALGISTGTSKSQLQRARILMHEKLYKQAQRKRKKEMVSASLFLIMEKKYDYIDKLTKGKVSGIQDKAPMFDPSSISSSATSSSILKKSIFKIVKSWKTITIAGTIGVGSVVATQQIMVTERYNIDQIPSRSVEIRTDFSPDAYINRIIKNKKTPNFTIIFPIEEKTKKHTVVYDTVFVPQKVRIIDTVKSK